MTAGDSAEGAISSAGSKPKDPGDKWMELEHTTTSGNSHSMPGPAACEPENNGIVLGDQGTTEEHTNAPGNSHSIPGQPACEPENIDISKTKGEVSAEKWSRREHDAKPEADKKKRKREMDKDEEEGPKTKKKEKEEQLDEGQF